MRGQERTQCCQAVYVCGREEREEGEGRKEREEGEGREGGREEGKEGRRGREGGGGERDFTCMNATRKQSQTQTSVGDIYVRRVSYRILSWGGTRW